MNKTLMTGAAVLIAGGLVAGGAIAGSTPQTMPAKDPSVTTQPSIQKAVPTAKLGGKVSITKLVTKGYDGSQTVTITPPSGSVIVQGFATISGGQLGAMVIRSTSSSASAYKINLAFPGEQGTPGQLPFRVQLADK